MDSSSNGVEMGTTKSWKSAAENVCKDVTFSSQCRDPSSKIAIAIGVQYAWSTKEDATCVPLEDAQCRCDDSTAVYGSKISASDVKCSDKSLCLEDNQCLTGTTITDMATTKAWTDKSTPTCATLQSTQCRDSSSKISVTMGITQARTSQYNATCTAIEPETCRLSTHH